MIVIFLSCRKIKPDQPETIASVAQRYVKNFKMLYLPQKIYLHNGWLSEKSEQPGFDR